MGLESNGRFGPQKLTQKTESCGSWLPGGVNIIKTRDCWFEAPGLPGGQSRGHDEKVRKFFKHIDNGDKVRATGKSPRKTYPIPPPPIPRELCEGSEGIACVIYSIRISSNAIESTRLEARGLGPETLLRNTRLRHRKPQLHSPIRPSRPSILEEKPCLAANGLSFRPLRALSRNHTGTSRNRPGTTTNQLGTNLEPARLRRASSGFVPSWFQVVLSRFRLVPG
jgi:hypothetical protein